MVQFPLISISKTSFDLDIDICSLFHNPKMKRLLHWQDLDRSLAMPSPPCQPSVPKYLEELGKFPALQHNGFSFLIDASGKLFKSARPSLIDVESNIEAGRFLACLVHVVSGVLMNFCFPACQRLWRESCVLPSAVDGSVHTCSKLSSSSTMRSTSCSPRAWLAAWSVCRLGPWKWA